MMIRDWLALGAASPALTEKFCESKENLEIGFNSDHLFLFLSGRNVIGVVIIANFRPHDV